MRNTDLTSSNFDFSLPYSSTTAESVQLFDLWKKFSYVYPNKPVYRLVMPLPVKLSFRELPLPVAYKTQQGSDEFNSYLNDALKRYNEISNGAIFDILKINDFLSVLKSICNTMQLQPYIMFNKFATKVQLVINYKDFVLDYDHEDLNTVFILTSIDGILTVKESALDKLEETLRSF